MPLMPPSDRLVVLRAFQLTRTRRQIPERAAQPVSRPSPAGNMSCPKCHATMDLVRPVRTSFGSDIHTFECTGCDHVQILAIASDSPAESRNPTDAAVDALEEARSMPPGAQRNMALKKAGLLRRTADNRGVISPKSNPRT